jgi:GTP pyrophosphokinase
LRPSEAAVVQDEQALIRKPRSAGASRGGVLVVGVDSLMTQLARCCRPAPPDEIRGFVTRGKGVSVHRADCVNLRDLVARNGERVIDVEWGQAKSGEAALYPVDVTVEAADRQGLLRDVLELFAKDKFNVVGAQTQTVKGTAWMTLTVEVSDASRLSKVLGAVAALSGVRSARRR